MIEFDIAAPRPKVWEYFTLPGQRPKWRGADEVRDPRQEGAAGLVPPTTACTVPTRS